MLTGAWGDMWVMSETRWDCWLITVKILLSSWMTACTYISAVTSLKHNIFWCIHNFSQQTLYHLPPADWNKLSSSFWRVLSVWIQFVLRKQDNDACFALTTKMTYTCMHDKVQNSINFMKQWFNAELKIYKLFPWTPGSMQFVICLCWFGCRGRTIFQQDRKAGASLCPKHCWLFIICVWASAFVVDNLSLFLY